MTIRTLLAGAALAAAVWAGPAAAQIQTLPETSRSESQSQAINNSLAIQSQNRAITQQNQFEVNSLRNQTVPQPINPPGVVGPGPVIIGR